MMAALELGKLRNSFLIVVLFNLPYPVTTSLKRGLTLKD